MSEATEMMEHMEHAGKHGNLGKYIGLTMAMLGVLLAVCSALVGGSRTELIAAMVEQTGASLKYQTVSTKYRMIQANLIQLHSLLPDPKVFKESGDEITRLEKSLPKDSEFSNKIMSLRVKQVLTTVTPTHGDMMSFVNQLKKLDKQADAANEWSESYESEIQAHARAAEHFEWGQLCAEVGIVICSVGLLLVNKPAWLVSVVLGLISISIVGVTYSQEGAELNNAKSKIVTLQKHYTEMSGEEKGADEELFKQIESEGGETPAAEPAAGHEEHKPAAEHGH